MKTETLKKSSFASIFSTSFIGKGGSRTNAGVTNVGVEKCRNV